MADLFSHLDFGSEDAERHDIRLSGAKQGAGRNNAVQLQAAFTAAATAGVPVYVPAGDWYYAPSSASLALSAPIIFHPAGRLVCNTAAGDFSRIDVSGITGWYAINPAIYVPNSVGQISETACFFRLSSCSDFEVRNLRAENCAGVPLLMRHCTYGRVSGTYMKGCWKDGIHITGTSRSIGVFDTHCRDGGDDVVAVVGYNDGGAGAGQPQDITISGTVIDGSKSARGISIVGGKRVTIDGFSVSNTYGAGVYVAGDNSVSSYNAVDVVVSNGTIYRCGRATSPTYGGLDISGRGSAGGNVQRARVTNVIVDEADWRGANIHNADDVTLTNVEIRTNAAGSGIEFNTCRNPAMIACRIVESYGHGCYIANDCTGRARLDLALDNVNSSGTSTNDGLSFQASSQLSSVDLIRVHHETQTHTINRLIEWPDSTAKLRVGHISSETAASGGLQLGYAQVTDTVTASPYVHTCAGPELVRVNGGTVSNIEIAPDGATYLSTGKTLGYWVLPAGAKLRVTYSVAPTVASHPVIPL